MRLTLFARASTTRARCPEHVLRSFAWTTFVMVQKAKKFCTTNESDEAKSEAKNVQVLLIHCAQYSERGVAEDKLEGDDKRSGRNRGCNAGDSGLAGGKQLADQSFITEEFKGAVHQALASAPW